MVMAVFITVSTALTLIVLAWVLRPLWRRRPLPMALTIVGFAIATGLLYSMVGTPSALYPARHVQPRTLAEGIARLETELKRDPNQIDGLRLLGRAYLQQERPIQAREVLARAVKLAPDDPDVLAEAAEARALADRERRVDDQAMTWLRRAVQLQPMHQRARWFLGIAQRQRGEHAQAAATWEPMLTVLETDTAAALRTQIDLARRDAGIAPLPPSTTAPTSPTAAAALTVQVRIDRALIDNMAGASVFVIARVPGGSPMPVAVEKHPLTNFPARITLDDSDGPMPTQKLSALSEVEVLARISSSGNAMRQQDDVETKPVRVALPAKTPVKLQFGAP